MKKRILRILAATLALAAMLSLAACGGNGGSSNGGNGTDANGDGAATSYKDTLTWAQGAMLLPLTPTRARRPPLWKSPARFLTLWWSWTLRPMRSRARLPRAGSRLTI